VTTQAFFITGTDTAAGKTLVSEALLHAAAAKGLSTLGLKPVAAGTEIRDGVMVNEDAWLLQQAASLDVDYFRVNPVVLEQAMAPHIAAVAEGVNINARQLALQCCETLDVLQPDFAVIEGAGGWCVPLNDDETMVDLCIGLARPVVLVVGMQLGCLNHALLTAQAIKASGLILAGWVANRIDPDMQAFDENVASLQARLPAPLLGIVPALEGADAARRAADHLNIDLLMSR